MDEAGGGPAAIARRAGRVLQAWGRSAYQSFTAKPELRWLTAILILATLLRVVWVLYAAREPQGIHDPIFYLGYADAISEGRGYALPDGATAYYPIGYPAALAAVFALVKYTPIPENLVLANAFFQVFLGVATVAFVYEIARRLFDPLVGLLAALWLALFPNLIYHSATFLTETLFIFLIMLSLLVLLSTSWREKRLGWLRLTLFAVLVALSALVRPVSLLFLPILPLVWLVAGFEWRRTLAYTGIVFGVTAAVLTPWAVRNFVVMDAPIIIATNVGDNLCIGHFDGATGTFALPAVCGLNPGPAADSYEGLDRPTFETRRNSDNTRRALTFARANLVTELKLLSRKAFYTWESDHDGLVATESYFDDLYLDPVLRTRLSRLADIYFFITISIGGLGLVAYVLPPRDGRRLFFLLALLALAGVPLLFFGDSRFHVPVLPLLVVGAAWAVLRLREVPRWLEAGRQRS